MATEKTSINIRHIITEIRIAVRLGIETLKLLKQAGWMNLVVISTMAAILSIFGVLFRSSMAVSSFLDQLGTELEISVYLKDSASPKEVVSNIKSYSEVDRVQLITKDEAWAKMQKQMKVPPIDNPLPNTLHVKLKKQEYSADMVKKLSALKEVEDVRFTKDLADKLKTASDIGKLITLVILFILGGLTMFVISNTINLAIQSMKTEIEIMRLMGVSNWHIRAPFILQGDLYGMSGAGLALIPLDITQTYLEKAATFLGLQLNSFDMYVVMLIVFVLGIIVGAGGSLISVKRYLKI